jgi:Trk-type K+ transport system membrane component
LQYHIGVQLIAFIIIAGYISTSRWAADFQTPALHRDISPPWYAHCLWMVSSSDKFATRFALFQAVSAYTNTGTSLVDQSMVPFQRAYPVILVMAFIIVAGNTGFVSGTAISLSNVLTYSHSSPFCKLFFPTSTSLAHLNLRDISLRFMM